MGRIFSLWPQVCTSRACLEFGCPEYFTEAVILSCGNSAPFGLAAGLDLFTLNHPAIPIFIAPPVLPCLAITAQLQPALGSYVPVGRILANTTGLRSSLPWRRPGLGRTHDLKDEKGIRHPIAFAELEPTLSSGLTQLWPDLLRSVFAQEVLRYPCGGRRSVAAFRGRHHPRAQHAFRARP